MDISLEIHCETCGSANYSLPQGSGDDAPILCRDCGTEHGSVGALKAEMMAHALGQSAESLRLELERLRGQAPQAG